MKQVIQAVRSGELSVTDVPSPTLRLVGILVRTAVSLVSAGTERATVDFANKNLLQKARARPDLVRQTLDKAQREGVLTTVEAVRNRLEQPIPLGYSSAGRIAAVGAEAGGWQEGERVACAGQGYACHAEMAYVPRNLAVRLPENVSFEAGAFTTLGAIALQGIRQAEVSLGDRVAVIGLGLLGQLSVQMLKAAGCQVFGVDVNPARVQLARDLGADAGTTTESALDAGRAFSAALGFDSVLITAATSSNEPISLAGELARDRGIVVAVGAVGLEIPRKAYYEKELDFRLSRSYGPGRYDPEYEEKGHDYPIGYVRWTEQRNMEAFVQLLSSGAVRIDRLITHRFPIDGAEQAYEVITGKTEEPFLGVMLTYDMDRALPERVELPRIPEQTESYTPRAVIRLGVIGAGAFANSTLLPALRDLDGLELGGIISGSGMTARTTADRFGFAYCASDSDQLLQDPDITWLAIMTRHNLHARQAIAAMQAGKDVFVEKPLALNRDDLEQVLQVQEATGRRLMVGFNRRFAPMVQEMHRFLAGHNRPLMATYRINAGFIDPSHWTQDLAVGGGRIVGEGCHFIDLLQFLIGAPPTLVFARGLATERGPVEDEVTILISFADGSVGTVIYAAGGDRSFGKERIEVIGDGKVAVVDDFRLLDLRHGGKRVRRHERLRPDKGHRGEWQALIQAVRRGSPTPIDIREIADTHRTSFAVVESMCTGQSVRLLPVGTK